MLELTLLFFELVYLQLMSYIDDIINFKFARPLRLNTMLTLNLLQDLDQRNKFSNYWKEITAISVCGCVMFLFDVIERGLQISDPFHSIWSTVAGESTAVSFTAFQRFRRLKHIIS